MASAVCPPGAICSDVIVTQIDGKPYYTVSSTKVTQGSDGKVNGGETSILYSQNQMFTSQQQQQKMVEKLGHTQNISKEMIYLMVKK